MFGPDLRLAHDLDEVPALAPRRRLKWQQIAQAPFLTANEKRQALGYQPLQDGGDLVDGRKNAENYERLHGRPQPRDADGRWAYPGGGDLRARSPLVQLTSASDEDEDEARQRNPRPDDRDCLDEWVRAVGVCNKQRAMRPTARSRGIYWTAFGKCLMGQVSERCGGNRVDRRRKSQIAGCGHQCLDSRSLVEAAGVMAGEIADIERLYDARKYEDLVISASDRLRHTPSCRETRFFRALALRSLGRSDESIADWTAIAALDPDDAAPFFFRAGVHFSRRRYRQAIADYNRAEQLDDGYFAGILQMDRARCHMRLGDVAAAKKDIDAIPPDPDFDLFRRRLLEELARMT